MLFGRKIYDRLMDWKQSSAGKTALLIEGARRVGKSTIAKAFAENEYESHILIDFGKAGSSVRLAFEEYLNDLDTFYMLLSTEYNVRLHHGKSLLIFDEVQKFPRAREAIKHLVADGRYHFLETGSLISIRENVKDIVIPSEEKSIRMVPMDFEEFCSAMGEEQLSEYIRMCFEKQLPLTDAMHHRAMLLFRQYMLVGGMPQSVASYIDSGRSFMAADEAKRMILHLYREDIEKADIRYQHRTKAIFDQIPGYLAKHEKRVRLSNLGSGGGYDRYEDAFLWLSDSMMANLCVKSSDPNVGLSMTEDRSLIKCYMGDTGLLVSHAFTEKEVADGKLYRQIINDDLGINQGMLFENAIAQCLTAREYPLYYYTHYSEEKHRCDMEIDFLLSNKSKINPKIIPIEVKSGKRYSAKSLEKFLTVYQKRISQAYIVHTKNLQIRDRILAIPAYMTTCL